MKKLLLALGLASALSFAQAQSSVQIYGTLDESVVSQTGSGLNATNMNSATTIPSNMGFRGTEDIGSGNKIGFDLNTGINLNNGNVGSPSAAVGGTSAGTGYSPQLGTTTLFYRAANVSFENDEIGIFKVGRQATPQFIQSFTVDALSTASGGIGVMYSLTGAGMLGGNGSLTGNAQQPLNPDMNQSNVNGVANNYSNGVGYYSPRLYGFKASAFLGVNNGSSATPGGSALNSQGQQQFVLDYLEGPYTASASYANILDNTGHKQFSTTLVGAGYTWNKITFKGTYYGANFGSCSQTSSGGNCQYSPETVSTTGVVTPTAYATAGTAYGHNFNAYALGASYALSEKVRIAAQYTTVTDSVVTANKVGMSSLYGDYSLSKRTTLYALASLVNNQGAANMGPIYGAPTHTPSNGQDITAVAVGMKHTF
jgi:predicted porin